MALAPKTAIAARVTLPDPGEVDIRGPQQPSLMEYLGQLNGSLGKAFDDRPALTTPMDFILLRSTSGNVFKLVVSNAGVLSATMVYQKP